MAQRSMAIVRENSTPWQDVTSICNKKLEINQLFHQITAAVLFGWMMKFFFPPHLALEAEQGDGQTDEGCDSQTQHH